MPTDTTTTAAGTSIPVTMASLPSRPWRLPYYYWFPSALAYAHVDAAREHGGEETRQEEACEQKGLYQHSRTVEVVGNLRRDIGDECGPPNRVEKQITATSTDMYVGSARAGGEGVRESSRIEDAGGGS